MNNFFGTEFWQNFVTTIFGAIIGILIALWLDRLIQKHRNEERKRQILQSLLFTLRQNLKILQQVIEQKGVFTYFPTFNVNLLILNATLPIAFEFISDLKILTQISTIQYNLEHLYQRIKLIFEAAVRNDHSTKDVMLAPALVHVERMIELVKQAMQEVEKKLPDKYLVAIPEI